MSGFVKSLADVISRTDMRAWFTLALFGLVWKVLTMIEDRPELLESAPFMQLVGPIAGAGGLLLIASFLFGSNKEGSDKSKALADNASTLRAAGIPVGGGADKRDIHVDAERVDVAEKPKPSGD